MKNLKISKQSYQDLLSKINSQNLDKKIAELPQILKIRGKIFYRFLPKNPLWQKRLALDLIFCKTAEKICKSYTFKNTCNNVVNPLIFDENELKEELYKAGLPQNCNTETLESIIRESRVFIKFYIDDVMMKVDVSNSQILYHRSYFMPANISKDVLLKYLNSNT